MKSHNFLKGHIFNIIKIMDKNNQNRLRTSYVLITIL